MMEMKKYFSDLVDSRDNRGLRHTLVDIVVMSIYAVLCGYTDAENMAFFMKLQEPEKLRAYETLEKNHGRIEKRKYKISQDIDYLTGKENWKGLKSIGKVESIREIDGKRSTETRYYILDQEMTSEEMSHIVRGHWEIENSLHWVLDVHFREDACKIKAEKAMQNLSLIRKICYNLMKLDKRFDKKKKMTYEKMSMLYTYHF